MYIYSFSGDITKTIIYIVVGIGVAAVFIILGIVYYRYRRNKSKELSAVVTVRDRSKNLNLIHQNNFQTPTLMSLYLTRKFIFYFIKYVKSGIQLRFIYIHFSVSHSWTAACSAVPIGQSNVELHVYVWNARSAL